jgi:hypothetical protein
MKRACIRFPWAGVVLARRATLAPVVASFRRNYSQTLLAKRLR